MMTTKLAILSDDLTGALDSAAPFANLGLPVVVATHAAALPAALAAGAAVVAVSLASREIAAAEAAARAAAAARELAGVPQLFKKIDSRLKGNVAAEVAAVATVRGLGRVVLCPAIPDMGRVVRNGALEGAGVAVPLPVAGSAVLPAGLDLDCPDAGSDAALDRIAAAAGTPGVLPVGARGLAAALARRMAGRDARPASPPRLRGPLVLVVGSRDPITLAQVECARALPGVEWRAAPDGHVPPGASAAPALIVQATPGTTSGAGAAEVSARLAAGLAQGLLAGRAGLVLTGGETAGAVLAALGIGTLALSGEVQPGLPLCRPLDFPGAPYIVTKSGGFGPADCLARLIRSALAVEEQSG